MRLSDWRSVFWLGLACVWLAALLPPPFKWAAGVTALAFWVVAFVLALDGGNGGRR